LELIVDTNILFSYFWKNSLTKKILVDQKMLLFAPEFALEEIKKYEKEIMVKTKLSKEEFDTIRTDLAICVEFLPLEHYKSHFKEALAISPDENDLDFFALAIKRKAPLWSNDLFLKKQSAVKVFSTKEVLSKWLINELV